eukprot:6808975-Prymnesium_polylepis.1
MAHHMTGVQIATFITQLLLSRFQLPISYVVNFNRDSASANGVGVRKLQQTFTDADDMKCMCHTLCHVGEHFGLSLLAQFIALWIKLMYGNSTAAIAIWRHLVEEGVPGFSGIRWYCTAEIEMQIGRKYALLPTLFTELEQRGIAPTLTPQLKQ